VFTKQFLTLDKKIRILIVVSLLANMGASLWEPLLGLYIVNTLGISILLLGLMNTVTQLVSSLIIFPSGFLSDNFGRKYMILLAIVFSTIAITLLFFMKAMPWLFFVSIFLGLSTAFMGPSSSAYIIDVIPDNRRGRAYAALALFQSLSGIITISIAGVIAGVFGFYWVFAIALLFELTALIVTTLNLQESLRKTHVESRLTQASILTQIRNGVIALKSPALFAVLFVIVFHQLGLGIQIPYMTLYTKNILGFALPAISLMLGLQQLGIFLGHFPSGMIVDKYGGEIAFAFHIFVTSPAMILFTIVENVLFASLILFFWGLTFGLDNVSRQKLIPKYKSESGVATAFGIISLVAGIVSLISPTIGGWVWTNFSPQTVFYTSAAVNVIGSVPLFLLWLYNKNPNMFTPLKRKR